MDKDNKYCRDCTRFNNTSVPDIPSTKRKPIMIVVEAPSAYDAHKGALLSDATGESIRDLIKTSGLKPSDFYFTPAVKCYSKDKKTPQDNTAITQCRHHLVKTIKKVKPSFIITMGDPALRQIQEKRGITKLRGSLVEASFDFDKDKMFNTYAMFNPSACIYDQSKKTVLQSDWSNALKFSKDATWKPHKVKYHYLLSMDSVKRFFRKAFKQSLMTYDIETSGFSHVFNKQVTDGFDYLNGYILCMSFSWTKYHAYVLPLVKFKGAPRWTIRQMEFILKNVQKLLESSDKTFIGHNIKFDLKFSAYIGTGVRRYRLVTDFACKEDLAHFDKFNVDVFSMQNVLCTMIGAHLVDENLGKGLKELAHIHTDMGDYEARIKQGVYGDNKKS